MKRGIVMTCLEAQSSIIAYIENRLEKDKKIEFLRHVKNCDDCMEELDIYYTMIEGMHQMDSNLPISRDFKAELDLRIDREFKQDRKKRSFVRSSVVIAIIGVLMFVIAGYINFLNLLYDDEQSKIKEEQGEYYYSSYFDQILFDPEERLININVEPQEKTEESFYSKINEYNANKK